MTNKGFCLITILSCFLFTNSLCYASKTTDLMSSALKNRSKGNISAAIKGFRQAVDQAPSLLQRNLALFMLGDCQLEANSYADAAETFSELSKKATTPNERAEALYKFMEASSNLGRKDDVEEAYLSNRIFPLCPGIFPPSFPGRERNVKVNNVQNKKQGQAHKIRH